MSWTLLLPISPTVHFLALRPFWNNVWGATQRNRLDVTPGGIEHEHPVRIGAVCHPGPLNPHRLLLRQGVDTETNLSYLRCRGDNHPVPSVVARKPDATAALL